MTKLEEQNRDLRVSKKEVMAKAVQSIEKKSQKITELQTQKQFLKAEVEKLSKRAEDNSGAQDGMIMSLIEAVRINIVIEFSVE